MNDDELNGQLPILDENETIFQVQEPSKKLKWSIFFSISFILSKF